jgi:hypothetical protein
VGQGRNGDAIIIADDHGLDPAGSVHQKADLPVDVGGHGCQRPSGFPADDLIGRDLFPGKPLQIPQLPGLEPVDVAGDRRDGELLRDAK